MSKVILFDIDGTLILSGGAGMRALNRACEEITGLSDAFADVAVAGRTDRIIIHDAMRRAGRDLDGHLLSALRSRYLQLLQEEIQLRGRGVKAILPGVRELLDVLAAREDVFLGLVTGNFEEGARIKLEYFDLWRYFRCGAYGDDAADRNELVPVAWRRALECGVNAADGDNTFVVGDTPHDIACARAAGARPIAVATGGFTADQLREAGAAEVLPDLSDTRAFLALVD
jgi:phosphoglycolate phosphatase-like HAD superfamily hydrolase